jgi:hypothetical protein
LVYHFKRSANQGKAQEYEQFEETYTHRVFNPLEARQYTGERRRQRRSELPPRGAPLDSTSLAHIEFKQVRYILMVDGEGQMKEGKGGPGAVSAPPVTVSYQLIAKEQRLDQEDLARIPDILRSLLSASKNIKLYPLESKAIAAPLEQLMEALRSILPRRQALTLAQVSQALVVNGMRINISGIETLADGFLKFLDATMLTSLTFLSTLTYDELKAFIGALGQLPPSGLGSEYWIQLAREKGLAPLLFDQVLYETRVTPSMAATEQEGPSEEPEEEEFSEGYWVVQMAAPVSEELLEPFFKEMPDRVNDLLMKGDEKQIRQLMKQLFRGFQRRPFPFSSTSLKKKRI